MAAWPETLPEIAAAGAAALSRTDIARKAATHVSTPPLIHHPGAWTAEGLEASREWAHVLDSVEQEELRRELGRWTAERRAGIPPDDSAPFRGAGSAEDFPLPALAARLERIRGELEDGTGAVRVRGIPLEGATLSEVRLLFWAIGLGLGTPVSQAPDGTRIYSVRDAGYGDDDPRSRGPNTSRELRFHTDRSDVVAFLCYRSALAGGDNEVASAMRVYNQILESEPGLIRILGEPFYYLRHTVDHGNRRRWCRQPVFSFTEGYFACCFLRVLIDRAYASEELPDMTPDQRRALDMVESVAEQADNRLKFRQESGDLVLINNWTVLHRRTAFEDHPESSRKRHILRLWLSMPNSRPIDPVFQDNWGAVAAGAVRGGMPQR